MPIIIDVSMRKEGGENVQKVGGKTSCLIESLCIIVYTIYHSIISTIVYYFLHMGCCIHFHLQSEV